MTKRLRHGGPGNLIHAISEVLPHVSEGCLFRGVHEITAATADDESDYYLISRPSNWTASTLAEWKKRGKSQKLLLGPNLAPKKWFAFPNPKVWPESNFRSLLNDISGLIVHSNRVLSHLAERSHTTDLRSKYLRLPACTNMRIENVTSFNERTCDVLFFEKYADIKERRVLGTELRELLQASKRVTVLEYGKFQHLDLPIAANNCKFVVYFSFYDTGAVALKEIQNYGAITFSLQEDLVDSRTGRFVAELQGDNMTKAYNTLIQLMSEIEHSNPNSQEIARINQKAHNCTTALDALCRDLIYRARNL